MATTPKPKLLLSWSTGKDSAYTLHKLRQSGEYEIVGLMSTFNEKFDRVAMHGIRSDLAAAQAVSIGLPIWRVDLPSPCSNVEYEIRMKALFDKAVSAGISHIAFGDIHLADVRAYREKSLEGSGLMPVFPIWTGDNSADASRKLAQEMVDAGVRSVITCVNPRQLDRSYAGRIFGRGGHIDHVRRPAGKSEEPAFLADFPGGADACGENGEYHTFCFDGPRTVFPSGGVDIVIGETVVREGFVYTDVVLDGSPQAAVLDSRVSLVEHEKRAAEDWSSTATAAASAGGDDVDRTGMQCPMLAEAGAAAEEKLDRTGDACPLRQHQGEETDRTCEPCQLRLQQQKTSEGASSSPPPVSPVKAAKRALEAVGEGIPLPATV